MNDHPTSADLEGFLCGGLSPRRTRSVVAHLVRGCASCRAAMAQQQGALFTRPSARKNHQVAEAANALDAAYDAALDRAMVSVGLTPLGTAAAPEDEAQDTKPVAPLVSLRSPGTPPEHVPGGELSACRALLEHCRTLRLEAPARVLAAARRTAAAADRLPALVNGESDEGLAGRVADVRALAWAELANALRISNDLRGAQGAMEKAFELRLDGTEDELVTAILFDLHASLLGDQRRFNEAFELLDTVYEVYLRHGDRHSAGRALLSKGNLTGAANDSEGAIRLLRQSQEMIDGEREPQLALLAVHNTAAYLVDIGRFEEAQSLVAQNRSRYRQASPSLRLRIVSLLGQIDAGLGDLEGAERQLLEVKQSFDAAGLSYRSAQTAIELAGVYLRQRRSTEARELAEEALRAFTDLGVGREILGTLLLLRNAFEMGTAEVLLERVARLVRRAEHDPAARVELG